MLKYIFIGFGLMLFLEGLLYFFLIKKIKNIMNTIKENDIEKIRFIALFSIFLGLCLVYFTIKYY